MKPTRLCLLSLYFAALFGLLSASQLHAQTAASRASGTPKQIITGLLDELGRTRVPSQSEISPDGQTVAWTAELDHSGSRIHLTSLRNANAPAKTIATGKSKSAAPCNQNNIAWSPDGHTIAFASDCATPDQQQIFIVDVTSNQVRLTPRKLTSLKGFIHNLSWSRDGRQLGFLFVENASRPPGALHAIKPLIGEISTANIAEVQRVAVLDIATARVASVTPADLHIYEFDWSPDSKSLAYIAAAPPGEDNWWVAQLYTQALANGTPHSLLKPEMQIAVPRWSPDGQQIAFIGGLMSDAGETGGDIYVVPAQGGPARDLTPNRKASPSWPHWFDAHHLGFTEIAEGQCRFSILDPTTGMEDKTARVTFPATIGDGVRMLSLSFSKIPNQPRKAALIQSSFDHPPEVWAGPLDHLQQVTHLNASQQPSWGKSESIAWTKDGFRVQGWLVYPKNYDPAKKYPLILWVHGGPSNQILPRWPSAGYNPIAFSALDYFVLMPNPRGSYGEGEAFTAANRKDFGYGDLRDLLAGVDAVTKKFPIDSDRVGITGWSYGGFMTMFAITQTHRFRAAMAGAGISDWKSYYGENSIDQWMIPFFGASVYDDPAVYAKSSAIDYIKNARTPTLIVVGDRDGECPAPQSFEMWHALRSMHVPVKLVVYPNEGHGFTSADDNRDVLLRAVEWFDQYMPPATAVSPQVAHP